MIYFLRFLKIKRIYTEISYLDILIRFFISEIPQGLSPKRVSKVSVNPKFQRIPIKDTCIHTHENVLRSDSLI